MKRTAANPKNRREKAASDIAETMPLLDILHDMLDEEERAGIQNVQDSQDDHRTDVQERPFSGSVVYSGFISAVYGGRVQMGLKRMKR